MLDARAYLREALEREIKAFNEKLREQEGNDKEERVAGRKSAFTKKLSYNKAAFGSRSSKDRAFLQ